MKRTVPTKVIVLGVIVALVVVWLAFTVKPINYQTYEIETLEELCQNEKVIFNENLFLDIHDANLRISTNYDLNYMDESQKLRDQYADSIRENYDINPVLRSDILSRLQGYSLDC